MEDFIKIRGARVHNLKNISVDIPRNKLVVLTGLSGSGKSSLAFDTIYAEGQRRYVESLSAYARQFLGLMDKPDVDEITGLSPTISIDQRSSSQNPRSTVGTTTEIYDYLRLLFARVGIPHCPTCGREIKKQTVDQIVDRIITKGEGQEVQLVAPLVRDQKGEHKHLLDEIRRAGYSHVRFDGIVYDCDEVERLTIDKQKKHTVEVVTDRLTVTREKDNRTRLAEAVEAALKLGHGLVAVEIPASEGKTPLHLLFSQHFSCPQCGIDLSEIEPRSFSFNSPHGACKECSGLGTKLEVDSELVVLNSRLTIAQGAIRPWARLTGQNWIFQELVECARTHAFSVHVPFEKLTKEQQKMVLYGSKQDGYEGVIPNLERRYKETDSDYMRGEIERYMRIYECPSCRGKRLRPEALAVTIGDTSIAVIVTMTITDAATFFISLKLSQRETTIAKQILKEINARLHFLQNVGLNYLTLDRTTASLSGGEAQRIRLATQIGSALVGVTYILDEPSIGLHQRDNNQLIDTLKALRNLGNSVIVVEHDEATIEAADHVVDIGPGAGEHGGKIVAEGTPEDIKKNSASVTGKYLAGKLQIAEPKTYRKGNGKKLIVKGAREFNLKDIDVAIPLGMFVCITGVSGSGKSTLMTEILARALANHFYRAKELPGDHDKILGIEHIDKVITIDQSPIGRTPRSNPATYTGAFTPIRDLYTMLPEARIRGYKAGRFSFNVVGGRCEACQGEGQVQIAMQFLPDVYVDCEDCHGKRYNREALEIAYNGKNIADVLDMTVEKGREFFKNIPAIHSKLVTLEEVGLGYMKLGQPATTLSGGEAQRIKLATELSRRATGKTLYILDEPTTGLHFDDVKRLLEVLQKLVDKGNTVLIIEHNLDVIKSVDWVIDLGPEGGEKGGELVAAGTPRDVAKVKESYTGQFLKKVLKK